MDADLDGYDTGLTAALGLKVVAASEDRAVIRWTADTRHLQPFGIVHGGVHCAVNETAASVGAALWWGERGHVVGVSNQTDFLRQSSPGMTLTATATPIHRGERQQLWLVETADATGKVVARGQVRLQNLEAR